MVALSLLRRAAGGTGAAVGDSGAAPWAGADVVIKDVVKYTGQKKLERSAVQSFAKQIERRAGVCGHFLAHRCFARRVQLLRVSLDGTAVLPSRRHTPWQPLM
jgi:hypothetical protein